VRKQVKHFAEEVSRIEILPEARYTLICLQSAIYIYSKNSTYLYDIVSCSQASISSAIYRSYEQRVVLAYLSASDSGESLQVHDYSVSKRTGMDTVYTVNKPFSAGYKVGGVQLDEQGQRVVVISADGCYVYVYALEDKGAASEEQIGQDQATPAYGGAAAEETT